MNGSMCDIHLCENILIILYVVSIGLIEDCLSSALTVCQALNDDNAYVLWFNTHCNIFALFVLALIFCWPF